jgi:hypothetical protein
MTLRFALAAFSFACFVANAALLLRLHIQRSGYSPVRHAVSDYAIGRTGRTFSVYLWVFNAGALALAGALAAVDAPMVPGWVVGVLVAMVAARFGVATFRTNLEGQALTRTGLLHYLFAVLAFAGAYVAIRQLNPILSGAPGWEPSRAFLGMLTAAVTPALIAVCITMWKPLRRIFGLCERVFIVVVALWFLTASGTLALTLR